MVVVASEPQRQAEEHPSRPSRDGTPGGTVNILTGLKSELGSWLASHMDGNAIDVTGADGLAPDLEREAAGNVKRVVRCRSRGRAFIARSPTSSS